MSNYFNPDIHAGLINAGGNDYIIADENQAKIDELPDDAKNELIKSTQFALAIELLVRAGIVSTDNPSQTENNIDGYTKGLALLGVRTNK